MEYSYKAYGLSIRSEIRCPELQEGDGKPELFIRLGKVPEFRGIRNLENIEYKIEPVRIRFSVPGIGRFSIRDGRDIKVEPAHVPPGDMLRFYLLSSAMCAAMYQKKLLVLHGSVIETPLGAVVFSGASGAGKSTVAGIFNVWGFRILSDDMCVIPDFREKPVVRAAYPRLKLCRDAADYLIQGLEHSGISHCSDDKMSFRLENNYRDREIGLFTIYELRVEPDVIPSIRPLRGIGKFRAIMRNIYRDHVLEHRDFLSHFSVMAARAAGSIRVKQVVRPREPVISDALARIIKEDLCQIETMG